VTTTITDAEFAHDLQDLTLPTLCRKYTHEASLHRNMLMSRGTGLAPEWRDFRAFLTAIGRRPTEEHNFILLNRHERTYGPGRVKWMTADEQAAHEEEFDRQQAAKSRETHQLMHQAAAMKRASAPNAQNFGQWTPMAGRQVAYTEVAKRLAIPIGALNKTMADGRTADELVKRSGSAQELINPDLQWLPPDPTRKQNFFEAFRIWHMQVQPQFARAATPTFLFLFIALPVMRECRWCWLRDQARRPRPCAAWRPAWPPAAASWPACRWGSHRRAANSPALGGNSGAIRVERRTFPRVERPGRNAQRCPADHLGRGQLRHRRR